MHGRDDELRYNGDQGLGGRLLAAVLHGEKTATSSLAVEYLSGEPLPRVGQRLTLVDHIGRSYSVVETTCARIIPFHFVGDDVACPWLNPYVDETKDPIPAGALHNLRPIAQPR